MFKNKNMPRIKTKVIEVKSTAMFGKSQMEKVTGKMTSEGWQLVNQQQVAANKYLLQFNYQMSPQEIAREDRMKLIRNGGLIAVFIILSALFAFSSASLSKQRDAEEATAIAIESTGNAHATQTATLWTSTPTLTPSPTFTATRTPTITYTPSITPTPTITPSPTITNTPAPTDTDSPTNTPRPLSAAPPTAIPSGTTYYSEGNAINVRSCPRLDCEVAAVLGFAEEIEIIDTRVDGVAVNGDTRWMEGVINDEIVYVHSSLVSRTRPQIVTAVPQSNTSTNNTSSNSGNTSSSNSSSQSQSQSQSQWNCSGDIYNCSSFSSCSEMRSYWNACPGDPSRLDGNDNDGRPCESRCG